MKSPENNVITPMEVGQSSTEDTPLLLTESEQLEARDKANIDIASIDPALSDTYEQRSFKTRAKRMHHNSTGENSEYISNNNIQLTSTATNSDTQSTENSEEKPKVKLLICKKKGSIFKSRAVNVDSGTYISFFII